MMWHAHPRSPPNRSQVASNDEIIIHRLSTCAGQIIETLLTAAWTDGCNGGQAQTAPAPVHGLALPCHRELKGSTAPWLPLLSVCQVLRMQLACFQRSGHLHKKQDTDGTPLNRVGSGQE